jgi:hypothetical protein
VDLTWHATTLDAGLGLGFYARFEESVVRLLCPQEAARMFVLGDLPQYAGKAAALCGFGVEFSLIIRIAACSRRALAEGPAPCTRQVSASSAVLDARCSLGHLRSAA